MVKHIVLWRVKDAPNGKQANALEIKRLLESMRGRIPGLLKLEVGVNFLDDSFASDCMLYCELTDREALAVYQAHPVHEAIKPLVRDLTTERRVVDYDC